MHVVGTEILKKIAETPEGARWIGCALLALGAAIALHGLWKRLSEEEKPRENLILGGSLLMICGFVSMTLLASWAEESMRVEAVEREKQHEKLLAEYRERRRASNEASQRLIDDLKRKVEMLPKGLR